MTPTETELERETLRLLAARGEDKTICPSEVARALGGDDWRSLMDAARAAAGRLADAGEVEITQAGAVVDLSSARGPVRIRRRRGTATAGE